MSGCSRPGSGPFPRINARTSGACSLRPLAQGQPVCLYSRAGQLNGWSMFREQARKRLAKKAKKGFRGFPMATVAFYGPDNRRASKLAVGIILAENQEAVELKRWFAEQGDVREDIRVAEEVLAYMEGFGVRSVAMVDRIIGCPHEEGIDYHGPTCPLCPYWAGRDRWSGERIH